MSALQESLFCHKHRRCRGSPQGKYDPTSNTDKFNKDPRVTETQNCYTFAVSDEVDPVLAQQCDGKINCDPQFHQPGGKNKHAYLLRSSAGRACKIVERLVKSDVPDMTLSSFEARCPVGMSKIALVTHPGEDYHFYKQVKHRKTRKSLWLHKDGGNPAKNYDADGLPIFNPEFASRDYRPGSFLNYSDFCGFYCVPRTHPNRLMTDTS